MSDAAVRAVAGANSRHAALIEDAFGVLVILLVPVLFLQKLAITASFWIAAIIVSELLLNPIVYYYLEPPRIEVIERREKGFFKRMLEAIARPMLSPGGRIVTTLATVGVIVLCAFFWTGLKVGDPSSETPFLWPASAYNRAARAIESKFGGVDPFLVVVELKGRSVLDDPQLYNVMDEYQRYMEGDPEVAGSYSLADQLANSGGPLKEFQFKWSVLPTTKRTTGALLQSFLAGSSPLATAFILTPRREATRPWARYLASRIGRRYSARCSPATAIPWFAPRSSISSTTARCSSLRAS